MTWEEFLNPSFLTPVGLLGITFILVVTGRLVPWFRISQLERENKHLRETVELLATAVDRYSRAAEVQTQTAIITESVMKALQQSAEHEKDSPS